MPTIAGVPTDIQGNRPLTRSRCRHRTARSRAGAQVLHRSARNSTLSPFASLHLQLIAPQDRYFDALEQICPGLVYRLPVATVEESAGFVRNRLADGIQTGRPPATAILDSLVPLLRESAR